MIKASVAYEMMEKSLHLIPSHESTSTYLSAYGVFNLESGDCVAVRAANHGTFLYNWLKMQDKPFNVDLLTSANIAITFLDGSIPFSQNNNIEMDNGAEPPVFVVRQYVYNCAVLDANDINVIISASKKLIVDGVYTDPFEEDSTKHAIIYREKTNEPPKDVTTKTLKKHRAAKKKKEQQQHTDNDYQELNTEEYMNKKLIRLTENDLHKIIKEVTSKVLNDDYSIFYNTFMEYANSLVDQLQNEYLNSFNLKVVFDENYSFKGKNWVAAYESSKGLISQGTILIALNVPYLYKRMKKMRIKKDDWDFNVLAQARITVGHEIGHGIIDYLIENINEDNEAWGEFYTDFCNGEYGDEEDLVEEFGESLFSEATGVYTSDLMDVLDSIIYQV